MQIRFSQSQNEGHFKLETGTTLAGTLGCTEEYPVSDIATPSLGLCFVFVFLTGKQRLCYNSLRFLMFFELPAFCFYSANHIGYQKCTILFIHSILNYLRNICYLWNAKNRNSILSALREHDGGLMRMYAKEYCIWGGKLIRRMREICHHRRTKRDMSAAAW